MVSLPTVNIEFKMLRRASIVQGDSAGSFFVAQKRKGEIAMKPIKRNVAAMPRLNKKRCQSGMDGMELVLKLENMENLYLPKEELKNTAGNTIVSMECVGGIVKV